MATDLTTFGRLPSAPLLSPYGPSLASRLGAIALRSTIALTPYAVAMLIGFWLAVGHS